MTDPESINLSAGAPPPEMFGPACPNRMVKVTIPWWNVRQARTESQVWFEPPDVPLVREFCREFPRLLALARTDGRLS